MYTEYENNFENKLDPKNYCNLVIVSLLLLK